MIVKDQVIEFLVINRHPRFIDNTHVYKKLSTNGMYQI